MTKTWNYKKKVNKILRFYDIEFLSMENVERKKVYKTRFNTRHE